MKILATSDLHGNLEGLDLKGADVVVIAGDIAPLRGFDPWNIDLQRQWINTRFREWTESHSDVRFVVIPGNHDFFPIARNRFRGLRGFNWKYDFSPNVHFLVDKGVELDGVKFYGTPWVPIISWSWAFEADSAALKRRFSKIPADLDVLVTHAPPHIPDCDVDFSLQTGAGPFGSPELAKAIAAKRPRLVFCGHIHTGRHGGVDFESSRVCNVSRLDERYEIVYEPTLVEI